MRRAILSVSALCMLAALSGRLMAGNRFLSALRLLMGLEITRIMLDLAEDMRRILAEWS